MGMKTPKEYGGLGLSQVHYNEALAMAGMYHASISTLLSAHQSIGLGEPLRQFGSEEQKQEWLPKVARTHISAFLLTEPDVGSDPARLGTTATPTEDGTGYRLNGRKLWATNGAIADVVVVMAKVPKSDGHKGGITAFILAVPPGRRHRRVAQPVHGPARHRELRDPARGRLRPERRGHRQGGPGPQDRPVDAQHRPPGAAGDLRRRGQVGDQGRRASSPPSASSGASPSASTTRSPRRSRSSRRRRSASRRWSTCRAAWPTTRRTTSASRRRSRSSTALRWAGRSSTRSCRSAAAAATRPPSRSRRAVRSRFRSSSRCATCASTGSSRARRRSCTC